MHMEYGEVVFICANQLLLIQVSNWCVEIYYPKAMALHILVGH